MRCFIAIELPGEIRSVLSEIQKDFKKSNLDVRWVRPENIHLTLKFLGTIEERMVKGIHAVLQKASGNHRAFTLTLSGAGVFPHLRSPRVVWVGVNKSSALTELQGDIETGLGTLGIEREKRAFTAHLTLGRFKSSQGKHALREKVESYRDRVCGSFDVGSISLIKSDLGPAGAKYTRVAEARLGKDQQ